MSGVLVVLDTTRCKDSFLLWGIDPDRGDEMLGLCTSYSKWCIARLVFGQIHGPIV